MVALRLCEYPVVFSPSDWCSVTESVTSFFVSVSVLGFFFFFNLSHKILIYWKDFLHFFFFWHHAAAKSLQSCPTLCSPIDGSPPGSPVPGILQARTLEWVAISFSNAWQWKVKVKMLSRIRLLAAPWTAAHQAPPSMRFSRQEYWSGLPLPSPFSIIG